MTVGNSEAEFGEWSPPGAAGPWKESMYREKANPVETTEMPMVIPVRNDAGRCGKIANRNDQLESITCERTFLPQLSVCYRINKRINGKTPNIEVMYRFPRSEAEGRN